MKKSRVFGSVLLRIGQTITFWTLVRHVKEQRAYLGQNNWRSHVGHGATSTHRIGNDWDYALCGAAVYSVSNKGEITCRFCQVLTP
jgi:hypothetical protein